MNATNQGELFTSFPALYKELPYFECEDGWFQLLRDLSEKLSKLGVVARQVKEKFGGLRFYFDFDFKDGPDMWSHPEADKLVEEAEKLSYTICEVTGKPGKLRDDIG